MWLKEMQANLEGFIISRLSWRSMLFWSLMHKNNENLWPKLCVCTESDTCKHISSTRCFKSFVNGWRIFLNLHSTLAWFLLHILHNKFFCLSLCLQKCSGQVDMTLRPTGKRSKVLSDVWLKDSATKYKEKEICFFVVVSVPNKTQRREKKKKATKRMSSKFRAENCFVLKVKIVVLKTRGT